MVTKKCMKLIQFATLFHTLKHGKPILDYESPKKTFQFLNLEENLKIHWKNMVRWIYGPTLHIMFVLEATKFIFTIIQYMS
jgi:hypothetical protein